MTTKMAQSIAGILAAAVLLTTGCLWGNSEDSLSRRAVAIPAETSGAEAPEGTGIFLSSLHSPQGTNCDWEAAADPKQGALVRKQGSLSMAPGEAIPIAAPMEGIYAPLTWDFTLHCGEVGNKELIYHLGAEIDGAEEKDTTYSRSEFPRADHPLVQPRDTDERLIRVSYESLRLTGIIEEASLRPDHSGPLEFLVETPSETKAFTHEPDSSKLENLLVVNQESTSPDLRQQVRITVTDRLGRVSLLSGDIGLRDGSVHGFENTTPDGAEGVLGPDTVRVFSGYEIYANPVSYSNPAPDREPAIRIKEGGLTVSTERKDPELASSELQVNLQYDDQPVRGGIVTVNNGEGSLQSHTDDHGAAVFKGLRLGSIHTINVRAEGMRNHAEEVLVEESMTLIDISMRRPVIHVATRAAAWALTAALVAAALIVALAHRNRRRSTVASLPKSLQRSRVQQQDLGVMADEL